MTPNQALDYIHNIAKLAPVSYNTHMDVVKLVEELKKLFEPQDKSKDQE